MLNTRIHRLIVFACCLSVAPAMGQDDKAPAEKPEPTRIARKKPVLVTRFYRLDELVTPPRAFPYTGRLPASTVAGGGFGGAVQMAGGGGLGGGGLGGGGLGGGGGFFQVPPTAWQGGGLGGGGMGFDQQQTSASRYWGEDGLSQVIELLTEFIDPDSWEDNGGDGLIVPMDQSLLVRATDENHTKVRDFLNQLTDSVAGGQPLVLDAWWLPLNPGERRKLGAILAADWGDAEVAQENLLELHDLTESSGGHHGIIRTRTGRVAHVSTGYRRPLVVGNVPVVADNAVGQSPVVTTVNVGIVLEIASKPVPKWRDLSGGEAGGDRVAMDVRTAVTGRGPADKVAGSTRAGEVDRYDIGSQVVEASAVCDRGKPMVIGSLAAIGMPPIEGDDKNEIYVVVRVRK